MYERNQWSESMSNWLHEKTGSICEVQGYCTNTTEAQDGQDMISYSRGGKAFVCDKVEFLENFKPLHGGTING